MKNSIKKSITPSIQGTPQQKMNQSINTNNISNISNKTSVSAYFDRKHQQTKEKIEHLRTEAYNKLISEVKPKPTISINSKKIIKQLFKRRNNKQNQLCKEKELTQKSLQRDNTEDCSSKQKVNTSNYTTYTNISQIEQYKSIMQSRERKIKEKKAEKKRKSNSLVAKPRSSKDKRKIVITEVIKCERDKLFDQEYIPYNEKAVFDIRSKLQKYYDCKTEYKPIPFNQQSGAKKETVSPMAIKPKENPIVVIRNHEQEQKKIIIDRPLINQSVLHRNSNINTSGISVKRREKDVQLLLEFTKGLGQNSINDNNSLKEEIVNNAISNNKEKVVRLPKPVVIIPDTHSSNNNSSQGHQLLKITREVLKDTKQLKPSDKLFIEERMRIIKTNFQLQEPPH